MVAKTICAYNKKCYYYLFSKLDFDKNLKNIKDDNIKLINLEDIIGKY